MDYLYKMGIYEQNGVCLEKNYENSNYVWNFRNHDSIIEPHEWDQGYVLFNEAIKALKQEDVNSINLELKETLNSVISRISEKKPEDKWFFFEITYSSYDSIQIDKVEYLPIRD